MKLRTLANTGLILVLASLLLMGGWGMREWRDIDERIERASQMEALQHRIHQMAAAIDYTTLIRLDPVVIEALVEDARLLSVTFGEVDHRRARLAASHMDEIALIGEFLLDSAVMGHGNRGMPERSETLLTVSRQIRIHHAGAREALGLLLSEYNQSMLDALYSGSARLGVLTIVFALLVLATALVIHHRLVRPIEAINAGLKAVARGDMDARIEFDRKDEIGDLARSFNHMAEQRQQHEVELSEARAMFQQIAENVGETFWLATPDNSQILYLSPAYETMWGHSREAVYQDARLWTEAIHPADRTRVLEALEQHAEGQYRAEYRVVHPDGSVRWINDRSSPVHDEDGNIVRIVGVARDVTEQHKFQAQLTERIKELRCLFQVLELTTSAELTPARVAERIVELLPESMRFESEAMACIEFNEQRYCYPEWRDPEAQIESRILLSEESLGRITIGYHCRPDDVMPGEELFLAEEQALINGIAVHFARMLERRRLTESLAQSERLKSVGELTGGMAHDFNNLLTVIIGNAELLHDRLGEEGHPMAGLAEMITTAGERGSELTRRMLAFARRQVLEPQVIDVNQLVVGMKELLRRSLGEDIELLLDADGQKLPALIDPAQIESAVLNLCLNARDAMPDGGRLTVETEPVFLDPAYTAGFDEVRPGPYIMLAVSDTGCGIRPADIARVFEPFFTTKDHGTGLGLSMVYGLVKQLRGHIRIYSEPGQGTTVRMYLPAADGQGDYRRAMQTEPKELRGTETILLVEDNDLVRDYASEQLSALGYEVIEAGSGPEALAKIEDRDDIDLLFTDVVMPGGMNGRQLADQVQAIRPRIKVLYTSGYTENAIVHHGRLDAGVELLAKPYHRHELARRVRTVLDR
jgi:PAS domain S-box-containing protein